MPPIFPAADPYRILSRKGGIKCQESNTYTPEFRARRLTGGHGMLMWARVSLKNGRFGLPASA
jgi:hypothetical protein